MNNEQQKAKELAELLTAFADGKQLEFFDCNYNQWEPVGCTTVDDVCKLSYSIRIKPETKRGPLTMQDLVDRIKEGKTMWVQLDFRIALITDFHDDTNGDNRVYFQCDQQSYSELMNFTFLDGTPCYKEVECE